MYTKNEYAFFKKYIDHVWPTTFDKMSNEEWRNYCMEKTFSAAAQVVIYQQNLKWSIFDTYQRSQKERLETIRSLTIEDEKKRLELKKSNTDVKHLDAFFSKIADQKLMDFYVNWRLKLL